MQTRAKLAKMLNLLPSMGTFRAEAMPDSCKITFLDVGAAGELLPRWKEVASYVDYIGLEPYPEASFSSKSSKTEFRSKSIFEIAADSGKGSKQLYLTRESEKTSFFRPNIEFLSRFKNVERFDLLGSLSIETSSLDDLLKTTVDFIKLDVQGSELRILTGAEETLKDCFGLELEVEFSQLYIGQPLFGEVSTFLKNQNFNFIDFTNLCRWERDGFSGFGQCVFGDALFLKTPEQINLEKLSDTRLISYLTILLLYKQIDLFQACIIQLAGKRDYVLSEVEDIYRLTKKRLRSNRRIFTFIRRCWKTIFPNERLHLFI